MRRLISILIALCLLLCMTPMTVSADSQVYEGTGSATMSYREFSGEDTTSKVMFGVGFDNYECERARAGLYSATVEFAVNLGT